MSLPAHLLDKILTRLDLCSIVRTSALSRAWRLRWESLPVLSLCLLDRPDTPRWGGLQRPHPLRWSHLALLVDSPAGIRRPRLLADRPIPPRCRVHRPP